MYPYPSPSVIDSSYLCIFFYPLFKDVTRRNFHNIFRRQNFKSVWAQNPYKLKLFTTAYHCLISHDKHCLTQFWIVLKLLEYLYLLHIKLQYQVTMICYFELLWNQPLALHIIDAYSTFENDEKTFDKSCLWLT